MTFKKVEDAEDPLGRDEQLELVAGRQLHLLDELGQALRRVLSELGQRLPLLQVKLPHGCCKEGPGEVINRQWKKEQVWQSCGCTTTKIASFSIAL